MTGVSLVVTGLTKRFNGHCVLDALDLHLNAGEVAVLSGVSGCGKSTLLRMIAGFELPDAGMICIGDAGMTLPEKVVPPWLRRAGMLFQGDALWPHLTIAEQVRMVADTAPTRLSEERLRGLADRLGIESLWNRFPGDLSGGEARRAALVRTLAAGPELLLLDEPFAHLDDESQRRVAGLIRDWHAETGATLLLVSHESALVDALPARRLAIESGRILTMRNV